MVKRRTTILGLGALAMGSGAAFTSAAFQNSVAPESDLRVVVEENLEVRKGPGFDDSDPEYIDDPDFFDGGDIDESGAFEEDETPLAYVNDDVNDDLVIKAAQDVGVSSFRFEEIIEISNQTTEAVDVGIAYDRDADQYGDDVDSPLSFEVGQRVYQFEANELGDGSSPTFNAGGGDLISPEPGADGVTSGSNDTIANDDDKPAAAVEVPEGETLSIDLVVDTGTDSDVIEDAAGLSGGFGEERGTVDILDEITVGTFDL